MTIGEFPIDMQFLRAEYMRIQGTSGNLTI